MAAMRTLRTLLPLLPLLLLGVGAAAAAVVPRGASQSGDDVAVRGLRLATMAAAHPRSIPRRTVRAGMVLPARARPRNAALT